MTRPPATAPLHELRGSDEARFGGKSSALGELLDGGIPVPPGFAVSVEAFRAFVDDAGLRSVIASLDRVDLDDVDALAAASAEVRAAMVAAEVPAAIREEVAEQYALLCADVGEGAAGVAVRSSACGEDSAEATFAGQQETLLWVRGADAVLDAIRSCWASLYSAEAIAYRARLGDAGIEPAMGVAVQLMVDAEVAGVLFTCNAVSGDPSVVAVNAAWGLGLGVVGGDVTPDEFLVSKVSREVVRRSIARKEVEHRPAAGGGTEIVALDDERGGAPSLDDEALLALLDTAKLVHDHFGSHQDIEWALARGRGELYVLQSRPVTAVAKAEGPKGLSAMDLIMRQFGVGESAS